MNGAQPPGAPPISKARSAPAPREQPAVEASPQVAPLAVANGGAGDGISPRTDVAAASSKLLRVASQAKCAVSQLYLGYTGSTSLSYA